MTVSAAEYIDELGRDLAQLFACSPALFFRQMEHGAIVISGVEPADLNYATLRANATPEEMEAVVNSVQETGVNAILMVEEGATQVCSWFENAGLASVGQVPVMERPTGPISTPSGLQARLAGADDSSGFHKALADAFSLPIADVIASMPAGIVGIDGCDVWVVNEGEEVAGCGVFLRDGDRVGIYSMATAEAHQRKGIGGAILNHAMAYYQERGALRFTLGATEQGFPLYERVGFKTVSQPHVFVLGNSTQFS